MENTVYNVPAQLDHYVANIKLKSLGIEIDKLTDEQARYIDSYLE